MPRCLLLFALTLVLTRPAWAADVGAVVGKIQHEDGTKKPTIVYVELIAGAVPVTEPRAALVQKDTRFEPDVLVVVRPDRQLPQRR